MMTGITRKLVGIAGDLVSNQLRDYQQEMSRTYDSIDGLLKVGVAIEFSPGLANNKKDVETQISFYTGQIKDKAMANADGANEPLIDHMNDRRAAWYDILFRDFSDIKEQLTITFRKLRRPRSVLFKVF